MENLQHDHLTNMDLQIDDQVRQQLNESGKWAKFISIVMFGACGLILLAGIAGGATIGNIFKRFGSAYDVFGGFNGAVFIIIIVFVVAIVAFVYYFLFNFSRKIKTALLSENTSEFNTALKSLKTFFIITTVFAILSLLSNIYNIFK